MLLKLFKGNHPSVIFLIPLLGIILWIPSLFNIPIEVHHAKLGQTTVLYNWVMNLFSFYPKASVVFALLLVIAQAFILIRLNFKHIFIENKTYLPSIFFVVFASIISAYQFLHPLLISSLFVLLAIDKAFLIEKSSNHFKRYYESGFLMSLACLFYPNSYVFILIIWLTMFNLRNFNWREWFSSVLGLVTPFFFYISILLLTDNIYGFSDRIITILSSKHIDIQFSIYSIWAAIILGFIAFFSILSGARAVGVKKINTRKYFSLFFWFSILISGIYFIHPCIGFEVVVVMALPLSIILSVFFIELRKKWVGELLFALTLVSALIIIWFQ